MKKLLLLALSLFLSGCEELGLTDSDPYKAIEKAKVPPVEALGIALASLGDKNGYPVSLTFEQNNAAINYIVGIQIPNALKFITVNSGTGNMVRQGSGDNQNVPKGKIKMEDALRLAEEKTGGRTVEAHLVKGRPLIFYIKTSKNSVISEVRIDAKRGDFVQ